MTYIPNIDLPYHFPRQLPDPESLRTNAAAFKTHGTTITETYDNLQGKWAQLPSLMTFERSSVVFGGLQENVAPYADYIQTGLTDMAAALGAFASDVEGFKPTWLAAKASVDSFHARSNKPIDAESVVPGVLYRNFDDRSIAYNQVVEAADEYQGYVTKCTAAIDAANPAKNPNWDGASTQEFLKETKSFWTTGKGWMDKAGNVSNRGGTWTYKFHVDGATSMTPAGFLRGKMPDWLGDKLMGEAVPGRLNSLNSLFRNNALDTLERNHQLTGFFNNNPLARYFNNLDPNKFHLSVGVEASGGRLVGALGFLPAVRVPAWMNNASGKGLEQIKKLDDLVGKVEKNKVFKYGGRAVGILDAGLTYKDEYSKGYNESLREHPEWSADQHRNEAVTDAAIVGTAENVGKVVGGVAGRGIGAAVGQAIIPIPGVGAAIGGFVGGIAGEWVGGKIGGAVGGFVNDWREDGFSGALDNAGKGIAEGAKDLGDGAKKIFDKVFKW